MFTKSAIVVIAAGSFILTACPAEDDGGAACKEDFDCAVGEICKGATADADGTCEEAATGAERNFGRVTLPFTSGEETYLLGVFELPRGEAALQDTLVSFSLSAGGSSAALRLAPKPTTERQIDEDFWRARLAWEAARRDGINRLIRDVRAGQRSLVGAATRQPGDCSACTTSTTEMCWKGACTDQPTLTAINGNTLPCALVTVAGVGGVDVNVLIDASQDNPTARQAVTAAAMEFADALDRVHSFLGLAGHAGALDRDGDGRLTVVYSPTFSSDPAAVGGFAFTDFLPESDGEATGNEADLMWARVPAETTMAECTPGACAGVITQELSVGTLVHEYTHLANFGTRVYGAGATPDDNEVLWLDEGMAHLLEDIAGFGASNIGVASVALSEWPSATFAGPESVDTVENRGMAYLLLRHIVDREGAAAGNARDAATRYKIHDVLLQEDARGFRHNIFQQRGADGIWSWMLATFATNNTNVTEAAAQSAPYLDTATVADTAQTTGFDPFGTFTDARGNEIVMEGPAIGDGSTDELSDFAAPFASEVKASGAIYYIVTGLAAGETVLTGKGDAQSDLQLRAQRVW